MSAARTAEAVTAYFVALNAHDADAVAALVTEDFQNEHTSAIARSVRGRAAYRRRLDEFLGAFLDLAYEIEDILVEEDRAAVFYRMSFRTECSDGGLRAVVIRGAFRFVVRDGEIAQRIDYWDGLDYQRQTSGSGS